MSKLEDAQFILDNSELLIKSDCKIVDGVLYEKLDSDTALYMKLEFKHNYRFFFNCDDYDYVVDSELEARLDSLFKK